MSTIPEVSVPRPKITPRKKRKRIIVATPEIPDILPVDTEDLSDNDTDSLDYHPNPKVTSLQRMFGPTFEQVLREELGRSIRKSLPEMVFPHGLPGSSNPGDGYQSSAPLTNEEEFELKYLPKTKIKEFSGDSRKFHGWWQSFETIVDKSKVSIPYKVMKLQQSLAGEALTAVQDLGFTREGYETAKERLETKYGGTRRYLLLRMEDMDQLKAIKAGNAKELEKFVEVLDVLILSLARDNKEDELEDGIFFLHYRDPGAIIIKSRGISLLSLVPKYTLCMLFWRHLHPALYIDSLHFE